MTENIAPPCHKIGTKPNTCALARYDRVVYNTTRLYGEWDGWRMAGRELVAPNGVRFRPSRLLAIAWAEKQKAMKAKRDAACKKDHTERSCKRMVITLPARERFDGQA